MYNFKKHLTKIKKHLTIFDYALVVIVLIGLLSFFFLFRRENQFITVRFKVTDTDVLYARTKPFNELAFAFQKGDQEKDELGNVIAEIASVDAYQLTPDQQVVYLDVKLKALYSPLKDQYSIKGKSIAFGQSFTLNFSDVKFQGIVVNFPGFQDDQELKTSTTLVKAQLRDDSRQFSDVYGVPPHVASAVKKGDTVQNAAGQVVAKVLEVESQPAKRTILTASGGPAIVSDPYLKDVFLTLELTTQEIEGKKYMFDYLPVLVNQSVPLNFAHISVYPVITEILP